MNVVVAPTPDQVVTDLEEARRRVESAKRTVFASAGQPGLARIMAGGALVDALREFHVKAAVAQEWGVALDA